MPDEKYMREALELAQLAASIGEVPVGCVIVGPGGGVIGRGYNRRESKKSPLSHAETEAIGEAAAAIMDWRLEGCSIYVTLEPCPMCAGAIINARIPVLVYGAKDPSMGCCGSVLNLFEERLGFHPAIYGGVLSAESEALLKTFFKSLR